MSEAAFQIKYGQREELIADALSVHRRITLEGLGVQITPELAKSDVDPSQHHSKHYVAYFDNEPIGIGRVRKIPCGSGSISNYDIEIDRVGIVEAQRGQGFGQMLMTIILSDNLKARSALLESPTQFVSFYEKIGFMPTGKFNDEDAPYTNMFRPLR